LFLSDFIILYSVLVLFPVHFTVASFDAIRSCLLAIHDDI